MRSPEGKFTANAYGLQHFHSRVAVGGCASWFAHQARQKNAVSRRGDALGEAKHQRMNARHLMYDDDRRSQPAPQDFACVAPVAETEARVVLQNVGAHCFRLHCCPRSSHNHLGSRHAPAEMPTIQPRPIKGIFVAITVRYWMFASNGRLAM